MTFRLINPESLGAPRGYSNGVLTEPGGRLLFIAGQIGSDETQVVASENLVEQFDRALANLVTVVTEAGGRPDQIVRIVIYVTNRLEYLEHQRSIGERYRNHMGKHFPAMTLVEVKSLLDKHAKVEIEATAVLDVK